MIRAESRSGAEKQASQIVSAAISGGDPGDNTRNGVSAVAWALKPSQNRRHATSADAHSAQRS